MISSSVVTHFISFHFYGLNPHLQLFVISNLSKAALHHYENPRYLRRHMCEWMCQLLLTKWQFRNRPDLGVLFEHVSRLSISILLIQFPFPTSASSRLPSSLVSQV